MQRIILHILVILLLSRAPCRAAEVLIIADSQLKPVVELLQGLRRSLRASTSTFAPAEVRGALAATLQREQARVVIALGREALTEALTLPPSVPVIYGMVAIPPTVSRPNTAAFYMATPASEYLELLQSHLPSLRRVEVVASRPFLNLLAGGDAPLSLRPVRDMAEFVATIRRIDSADAILLLPDSTVMAPTAMEEAFLLSFRRRIPLLGVSERHVREGALLAMVVDMVHVGRTMGEYASRALKNGEVGQPAILPPRRFDLFLNMETARRMRIAIPDRLLRMAKRVFHD